MSWVLGKAFKKGKKTVRYAYRGGKKSTKTLVRKVVNKKNMKATAKTILIAGVWYMFDNVVENRKESSASVRARNRKQSSRERGLKKR
jgi:hypothetical protein